MGRSFSSIFSKKFHSVLFKGGPLLLLLEGNLRIKKNTSVFSEKLEANAKEKIKYRITS